MKDLLCTLREARLFSGIPDEIIIDHIIPHGKIRQFAADEIIISPQDIADHIGVIVSGRVHIAQIFSDGTSSLMNVLNPSMTLAADLIATEERSSPYYAISAEPSRILILNRHLFSQLEHADNESYRVFVRNLMTIISHENMKKHYRIAILSQNGLRARVLTYLIMQSAKRKTESFRIPFSRIELADFLCVNRSALSHELSKMRQEGLIDFHKDLFVLTTNGKANCTWSE